MIWITLIYMCIFIFRTNTRLSETCSICSSHEFHSLILIKNILLIIIWIIGYLILWAFYSLSVLVFVYSFNHTLFVIIKIVRFRILSIIHVYFFHLFLHIFIIHYQSSTSFPCYYNTFVYVIIRIILVLLRLNLWRVCT